MEKNKKVYVLAFILLIIDQVTKIIVKFNLILGKRIEIIRNFFYINYVENEGAAWSMFKGKTVLLVLISALFLIFLIKCLKNDERKNKINILSYSFIIGGILGNIIDRIIYKKVIDFLSFKILGYNFPIFNVADTLIVIGTILFIIDVVMTGFEQGNMEPYYKKIKEKYDADTRSRRKR